MKQTHHKDSSLLRVFIALNMPEEIRRELLRLQEEMRTELGGDISWVKPEHMHLTLRFLGTITANQVEQIKVILQEVAKKNNRFALDLGAINAFPQSHTPRVIWIGINTGFNELNQLSAHLEEKLRFTGFRADDRAFYAHLTLGRVKQLDNRAQFSRCIDTISPRYVSAMIDRLFLFQSVLHPTGPVYTPLADFPLK